MAGKVALSVHSSLQAKPPVYRHFKKEMGKGKRRIFFLCQPKHILLKSDKCKRKSNVSIYLGSCQWFPSNKDNHNVGVPMYPLTLAKMVTFGLHSAIPTDIKSAIGVKIFHCVVLYCICSIFTIIILFSIIFRFIRTHTILLHKLFKISQIDQRLKSRLEKKNSIVNQL